jgi:N-acetylglucosaminyldiphosphoundecaprenol N-acetyl-beta-D-mannosaminyltransferase
MTGPVLSACVPDIKHQYKSVKTRPSLAQIAQPPRHPSIEGANPMTHMPAGEEFLGVGFHAGTLEEATRLVLAQEPAAPFRYVVTPNVQHMVAILENPARFAPLYQAAWRVFCDSRVLARLARLRGRHLPVVTGSDLTARLLDQADRAGLKIALIGPSPDDVARLRARFPRLAIALHTPPFGFIADQSEVARCIEFVVREQAALVFLGVGSPRQEILAARIAADGRATGIGLCIGASIDFLTGRQRRAPLWMQRAGLEWLHRLLSDPARLASRYLIECPKIFLFLLRRAPPSFPPSEA